MGTGEEMTRGLGCILLVFAGLVFLVGGVLGAGLLLLLEWCFR